MLISLIVQQRDRSRQELFRVGKVFARGSVPGERRWDVSASECVCVCVKQRPCVLHSTWCLCGELLSGVCVCVNE